MIRKHKYSDKVMSTLTAEKLSRIKLKLFVAIPAAMVQVVEMLFMKAGEEAAVRNDALRETD